MKTKLNETERDISEWIFDGPDTNRPGIFLEPGEEYLTVSFQKMLEGAWMLEARGLVHISAELNGCYDVNITDSWLAAEGMAWNGKTVVEV